MVNTSRKGHQFEHVVKRELEESGWLVLRTPGSSWTTGTQERPIRPQADLLAFRPDAAVLLFVQCKAVKPRGAALPVSGHEWRMLWAMACLSPLWAAVVAVAGRTYSDPRFAVLTGPHEPYSRSQSVGWWTPGLPLPPARADSGESEALTADTAPGA